MIKHYRLEGHDAVPCSLMEWASAFEAGKRHVALDDVGGVRISTVFLGLDHQFGEGPPLLFETMVFGGPLDGAGARYSTWAEAAEGHLTMRERVLASRKVDDATVGWMSIDVGLLMCGPLRGYLEGQAFRYPEVTFVEGRGLLSREFVIKGPASHLYRMRREISDKWDINR